MSKHAQAAEQDPVKLNEVLWKELQAVRPALAPETEAAPQLEELYERIGKQREDEALSAICLSGGGIRSATFNLGVLQQLASLGILKRFDFLSSVSGGGYIASWLQAWMHHDDGALEQLQKFSRPTAFEPEPQPIRNLREYSNYLTPKLGLFSADTWTAAAMVLRNMLLNWLVIVPALAAVVAVPWLFLATVEHNEIFNGSDGLFVGLATLTELVASVLVFRSRRYSSELPYSQGKFVMFCLVPVVAAAAFLCIAVLGLDRWIVVGRAHTPAELVDLWIFVAIWCVVNPVLGWTMIELNWFKPKDLKTRGRPIISEAARAKAAKVKRVRRHWEFGGLLFSGAVAAVLLVGIVVYWLESLYASLAGYVVLGLPILLTLYLLARTLFVAFASVSENPTTAAPCGNPNDADREWWGRLSGWVLLVVAGWIGVTAICLYGPQLLNWLAQKAALAPALLGGVGGVSGVVAALVGSRDGTNASDAPANASLLRRIALAAAAPVFAVIVIVLVAWAVVEIGFFLAQQLASWNFPAVLGDPTPWAFLFLPIALALLAYGMGRIVNVNRFSLNGFYRNRLARAYLGASRQERDADPFTGFSLHDNVPLWELQERVKKDRKLLPIVNTTLNLVRSGDQLAWQQRKSESFSMTPFFCGNHHEGYRPSHEYGGNGGISLSTAMAISGAAANPNMGYNSSPAVGFLMALFNARLGAWLGNTNLHGCDTYRRSGPRQALWPLFAELFGMTHSKGCYVNLSDGGHFDNLGLYEVVLRRCRQIVVCDAGCDGDASFEDLGNAIRKIRIDFGISINFEDEIEIRSNRAHKPGLYCAIANINYRAADGDVADGTLLYIKATKRACGVPVPYDVYSYSRASKTFPHESTSDQWFSESQFESYRALGKHAATQILGECPVSGLGDVFARATSYLARKGARDVVAPEPPEQRAAASASAYPPDGPRLPAPQALLR